MPRPKRSVPKEPNLAKITGYKLFTQDFYKDKKRKFDSFKDGSKAVQRGWSRLNAKTKEKYADMAKNLRGEQTGKRYLVPFYTRCAPNQFIEVCKVLRNREDKIERLKKIGFDKLINLSCPQIPRGLCGEMISAFDPERREISIRGETIKIGPKDVQQFMGLPCNGRDIVSSITNDDGTFVQLRSKFGKVRYTTIATWLVDREDDADFEFFFVIYALGTLLCPTASVFVSDRILKLMALTRRAFGEYDWCSFVFNELSNSIAGYKRKMMKGKVSERFYIGGCVYFIMIFCLQHFPLGEEKASRDEDAIAFWDEDKVKSRVGKEKESNNGLLYASINVAEPSSNKLNIQHMLSHPEIKRSYERTVSRVMAVINEEYMLLQSRLLGGEENAAGVEREENARGEEEGAEEENTKEFEDDEGEEVSDTEHGSSKQRSGSEEVESDEDKHVAEEEHNKCEVTKVEEGRGDQCEGQTQLRKSTRVRKPALGSPWVTMVGKVGKKRSLKEKEAVFQFCMTRCNEELGQE